MSNIRDKRTQGWAWVHNALVREHGAELGVYGIAVYTALATYAGRDETAYPSYKTLADAVGCSRRKAIDAIKDLERLGWIKVEKRHTTDNPQLQSSNLYTLLPCPVNDVHGGSARNSSGVVNDVHGGSARDAHEKESLNNNQKKKRASESAQQKTNGNEVPNDQGTPIDEAKAIWEDVCDARPDAATAMTLHGSLATCDVDWQPSAFRKALKTAYRNVSLDAGRIRVGYLMDSYEREAARMEDKPNPASYDVADNSAIDRLEDRWSN